VSNFMPEEVERLIEATTVVPAVDQIEVHPCFQQKGVQAVNSNQGTLTQAWSRSVGSLRTAAVAHPG
jgi:2,5-diketo-D-gluconate reductase A